MSVTIEENGAPFSDLLSSIGQLLEGEEVRYMKFLLQGHVGKETLEYLETGEELTEVLRTRGLVSEKRLAFMRKLLIEAKCLKLVHLLDEYKEKFAPGTAVGEFSDDAESHITSRAIPDYTILITGGKCTRRCW